MVTVAEALAQGEQSCGKSDSPRLDAEVLLCHTLDKQRSWLYAWPEKELSPDQEKSFMENLQRRSSGEPVAFITGRKEFWSREFFVNAHVLVPRPETELLVETVLAQVVDKEQKVLDLGAGSGVIGITLALEKPAWNVVAIDKSAEALKVIRENCRQLQVSNLQVMESDWFSGMQGDSFDVVVSNPPYIRESDTHLMGDGLPFEPQEALVSQDDGYADLYAIIDGAPAFMSRGGFIVLEHGYNQAKRVREKLQSTGFGNVRSWKDLAGGAG
jgi:release factor glutamine methyltransferase